jgi:hypothetical protein
LSANGLNLRERILNVCWTEGIVKALHGLAEGLAIADGAFVARAKLQDRVDEWRTRIVGNDVVERYNSSGDTDGEIDQELVKEITNLLGVRPGLMELPLGGVDLRGIEG